MARQVPDNQYLTDPFTITSPVRSNLPRLNYQASPEVGGAVPVVGILMLAGAVLLFEHLRRRGGGHR